MSNRLNFIDLFSGCGGFSNGLEQAGHKCLLGIDFEEAAVKTFAKNHTKAHALHMDIHKLSRAKLKNLIDFDKVDMVVGGPPCQGFSTVGRGNASDERNSLFKEFIRIVKMTKPQIVLFENVTGLLASKNIETLKNIFSEFEKLGYQVDAKVLSADEFGVPSKRKRAIIMGVKSGKPRFPKSMVSIKKPVTSVRDAFFDMKTKCGEIYNHDIEKSSNLKEIDSRRLSYIPAGSGIRYERDELAYLPKKLRYNVNWKTISEGRFRQTRLQRLSWETPGPTILTSKSSYYHPKENRYLTVREAAKLQSFPNDFVFEGSVTAQFRQVGNAVPPSLAKKIGLELKKIKFDLKKQTKISFDGADNFAYRAFTYKEKPSSRNN